jgi:hypothetical protein
MAVSTTTRTGVVNRIAFAFVLEPTWILPPYSLRKLGGVSY